jgi:DNA-binding CsgD family transcriptional regulator
MKTELSMRLDPWLDAVGDLLRQIQDVYPHQALMHQFAQCFDAAPSWNWRNADGTFGFEMLNLPAGWPTEQDVDHWAEDGLARHPLLQWYAKSGLTTAQSMARVPFSIASRRDHQMVRDELRTVGFDEQLSVPYVVDGAVHRAFVLARTGQDFTDAELETARRIQPLLELLNRQVRVLADSGGALSAAHEAGLTGRELSVLRLLAEGHTSEAIARRLASSPRTVQKHLQHVYRKLEVSDRLMAVRVAEARGLVPRRPERSRICVVEVRGGAISWRPPAKV